MLANESNLLLFCKQTLSETVDCANKPDNEVSLYSLRNLALYHNFRRTGITVEMDLLLLQTIVISLSQPHGLIFQV